MPALIDRAGQRYGRLVAISKMSKNGLVFWRCRCDCGTEIEARACHLASGASRSCGCLRDELIAKLTFKHGHHRKSGPSRTYISWRNMHIRCGYPGHPRYRDYGGRGIRVCKRWSGPRGFIHFLADMGERPAGKTLDRYPNKNGNYTPSNCRWATPSEQAYNRNPRWWRMAA